MKLDVWEDVMALERQMDDLFGGFWGERTPFRFPARPGVMRRPFVPTTDVYSKNGSLIVRFELPGLNPAKDVTVTIEDGYLVVRGERKRSEEIKEEDYYRMEASYGIFERRIPLPEGITEKDIRADYKAGVLEIEVPKPIALEGETPKVIPIKTATAT